MDKFTFGTIAGSKGTELPAGGTECFESALVSAGIACRGCIGRGGQGGGAERERAMASSFSTASAAGLKALDTREASAKPLSAAA